MLTLDKRLSLKEMLQGHSDEFAKDVVLLCTIAPFGKGCALPGMRWSVAGANAMLRLRCARAPGRFDEEFALAAKAVPTTDRNLEAAA